MLFGETIRFYWPSIPFLSFKLCVFSQMRIIVYVNWVYDDLILELIFSILRVFFGGLILGGGVYRLVTGGRVSAMGSGLLLWVSG